MPATQHSFYVGTLLCGVMQHLYPKVQTLGELRMSDTANVARGEWLVAVVDSMR